MIHCYKLNGFNIVLDIESGSIHSVDDIAYDAICIYERGGENAVYERIREKYTDLPEDELDELVSDIDVLIRGGKLFSPDIRGIRGARADATGAAGGMTLKALCLNVSHVCNMTCSYCFAGSGKYGGGGELMPFETGKRAIDFLVENSGGRVNLDVDFFGGEPLLNWGVVKEIVAYARGIENVIGKKFRFTLTTNGLLIDDDVIDFTNREMRNVVLSLDGRPKTHDAMRKLCDGGGSYHEVVPKFKKLVEARGNRDYYIRGTFTRDNPDFVSDITHIAELGFTELSMEPVVAERGAPYALTMDDLPWICGQYETLAIEMLKREKEGRGFTFYHYKLDLTGGPCLYKRAAGCGVGVSYLAVTPRGELYPCHQFVGSEGFLLGDIWRGPVNKQTGDEFIRRNADSRSECRKCWARLYCSGGCAANAYNAAGSVGGVYELGCEMFKKRIECAIMMKAAGPGLKIEN